MKERVWRTPRWLPWAFLAAVALFLTSDLAIWGWRDLQQGLPVAGIVLNTVLRLVPVALLLLALGIMVEVVGEEAREGRMTPRTRRLLFWAPRVSMLVFAALLSLFALDVFEAGYSPREMGLAFLLHLIPVLLLLAVLAIAWRWEWVGAAVLIGWALFYLRDARGFPPSVYVYMAGLPFVLGLLFLLNWCYRGEVHTRRGRASSQAERDLTDRRAWPRGMISRSHHDRDPESLHARAESNEFTSLPGTGAPYETPEEAGATIDSDLMPAREPIDDRPRYLPWRVPASVESRVK